MNVKLLEARASGADLLRFRRAERGDLEALLKLESNAFTCDRLSRKSFRTLMGSKSADLIIAESDAGLVGYALVFYRRGSSTARIYSIAVVPDRTRRGIGARLLRAAEEAAMQRRAARIRLEVNEFNAAAISLYERFGYELFGRKENYYDDGSNALRFEKRLA
jgi:ribosomal-protein-alanine acetyltransferase